MAGLGDTVELLKAVKPRRMRTGLWFALILGALVTLAGSGVAIWWGSIRESLMDPGQAYQTFTPPPAPDYAQGGAWALWASGEAGTADVFFIAPTTYQGRGWNAEFDSKEGRKRLDRIMLPNYAGPFAALGKVYAPLYRQASLYSQMTLREDAREARAFPYDDIRQAFERYRAQADPARPLIIVGVEQGALMADRLAREVIAVDPVLKSRLAAVYLIEAAIPAAEHGPGSALPACTGREQFGCVVAYLAEAVDEPRLTRERLRHAPAWQGARLAHFPSDPPLCVNPLNGKVGTGLADASLNLGAANATGLEWGEQPGHEAGQVSAECVAGVLKVSRARSVSLRGRTGWADSQRVRAYNWFYADLTADATARVAAMGANTPNAQSPL